MPTGRYRHFKGAVYVVVGTALHSETEEPLVVYRAAGSEQLSVRPFRTARAGPRRVKSAQPAQ